MTEESIKNDNLLSLILANQQETVRELGGLKAQTATILQTNIIQEGHLGALNSAVKHNQEAIIKNSIAVAVALEQVQSNKGNLALMWRILIPVITATVAAGGTAVSHLAGMW